VADEPTEQLPDHIRQARSRWSAGRVQAQLTARAARGVRSRVPAPPKAKARPPAALMAKIDRILAHARPDFLRTHPPAAGQDRALNVWEGRRQGGGSEGCPR
jgi:hypothetical protein